MGLVVLRAGARARRLLLLAGLVFAALPAGSALAATIGKAGGESENKCLGHGVIGDTIQPVPSGGGTITSFSFQSTSSNAGEQLDFLLLRPQGVGQRLYTVVGKTGLVTLAGTGLETFPTNIPAQAGDILGFWFTSHLDNCYRFGTGPLVTNFFTASDPNTGALITMQLSFPGDLNESARLSTSRVIRGGPGNDRLHAGPGNVRIYGGGGNDIIRGGAGNDVLDGGPGNDTIYGGRGEDLIWGGPGNDTIYGGRGYDIIYGGPGNDRIVDHRGPATVFPGSGTNRVNVADGRADDRVVCRPGSINHIVADRGDQISPSCRVKGSSIRYVRVR